MILCIDGACSLLTACLFYVAAKDLTRLKSHRCVRVSLLNNTELKINVTANGSIQRMMLSTPRDSPRKHVEHFKSLPRAYGDDE